MLILTIDQESCSTHPNSRPIIFHILYGRRLVDLTVPAPIMVTSVAATVAIQEEDIPAPPISTQTANVIVLLAKIRAEILGVVVVLGG